MRIWKVKSYSFENIILLPNNEKIKFTYKDDPQFLSRQTLIYRKPIRYLGNYALLQKFMNSFEPNYKPNNKSELCHLLIHDVVKRCSGILKNIHEEIKCRLKAGNSCYYSAQTLLSSTLLSKNFKIKRYKTIILAVVLYVCETWSLTLREESKLRVFENRILRRIFLPKRDNNGEWRRLHNEELHSLYRSPNIVGVLSKF